MRLHLLIYIMLTALMFACQPADLSPADEGDGSGDVATSIDMPTSVGEGTSQSPYTVGQVLSKTTRTADVWVAGYIVGYVTNTINKAHFTANEANSTNLIIAASPDETDKTRVLTVELPQKIRTSLSLHDNPTGYKQAVMLHANEVTRYCNTLGIKGTDRYLWLGGNHGLDLAYMSSAPDNDDEQTEQPDDETPDNQPTLTSGHIRIGTNIEDVYDVTEINDRDKLGYDSYCPCTPDFLLQKYTYLKLYFTGPRWLIGYVVAMNDDSAVITGLDKDAAQSLLLDLEDEYLDWMKQHYDTYHQNYVIRIFGQLKENKKDHRYHIINVESLEWLGS